MLSWRAIRWLLCARPVAKPPMLWPTQWIGRPGYSRSGPGQHAGHVEDAPVAHAHGGALERSRARAADVAIVERDDEAAMLGEEGGKPRVVAAGDAGAAGDDGEGRSGAGRALPARTGWPPACDRPRPGCGPLGCNGRSLVFAAWLDRGQHGHNPSDVDVNVKIVHWLSKRKGEGAAGICQTRSVSL